MCDATRGSPPNGTGSHQLLRRPGSPRPDQDRRLVPPSARPTYIERGGAPEAASCRTSSLRSPRRLARRRPGANTRLEPRAPYPSEIYGLLSDVRSAVDCSRHRRNRHVCAQAGSLLSSFGASQSQHTGDAFDTRSSSGLEGDGVVSLACPCRSRVRGDRSPRQPD